jgi:uncharacterized membrane protein
MFVAAFVSEGAAGEALKRMKEAKKSGDFFFDNAAVIRSSEKGKVHINETGDMSTGKGAGIGALIGGVIGLLGGPAGVAAGVAIGGGSGAIAALRDSGFDDDSLKEVGSALLPGTSAIAATTSRAFTEEVRKRAQTGETLSIARDLASDIRANQQAGQEVLYSLLITETGLAASKVVASDEAVAVFGIAASEEGVVAGQAVATEGAAAYEVAAATEDEAAYEAGVVVEEDESSEEEQAEE